MNDFIKIHQEYFDRFHSKAWEDNHALAETMKKKGNKWDEEGIVNFLAENRCIHLGGFPCSGRTTFIANLVTEDASVSNVFYLTQTKAQREKFDSEFKHIRPGVCPPDGVFGPLDKPEDGYPSIDFCAKPIEYVVIDDADDYKGISLRRNGLRDTLTALVRLYNVNEKSIIIFVH